MRKTPLHFLIGQELASRSGVTRREPFAGRKKERRELPGDMSDVERDAVAAGGYFHIRPLVIHYIYIHFYKPVTDLDSHPNENAAMRRATRYVYFVDATIRWKSPSFASLPCYLGCRKLSHRNVVFLQPFRLSFILFFFVAY